MISAAREAGPPALTLLITIFVMVAIARAEEIRRFWADVFRGSAK